MKRKSLVTVASFLITAMSVVFIAEKNDGFFGRLVSGDSTSTYTNPLILDENNAPSEYILNDTYQDNRRDSTSINSSTMVFDNAKHADNAYCALKKGGKFYKLDKSYGLREVVVNFDGALTLKTSLTQVTVASCDTSITLQNNVAQGVCANAWFIFADADTTIYSVKLYYGCDRSSEITAHLGTPIDEWTVIQPATPTTEGVEERIACSICGSKETRPIPVVGATGIAVKTPPTKLAYKEGEYFSTNGLTIVQTYAGFSYTKDVAVFDYYPKTELTPDITEITVTYGTFETKIPITVEKAEVRLAISGTYKEDYSFGENFNSDGLVVTKITGSKHEVLDASEYTISDDTDLRTGSIPTVTLNEDTNISAVIPVNIQNKKDIKREDVTTKKADGTCAYATNETLKASANEKDYLGNFEEGDVITYEFKSTSDAMVNLKVSSASTYVLAYSAKNTYWPTKTGDVQINKLYDFYINGIKVDVADDVILKGEETTNTDGDVMLLGRWKLVDIGTANIRHGVNKLQIVFLPQIYKNAQIGTANANKGIYSSPVMDFITVDYSSTSGVACEHDYAGHFKFDEYFVEEPTFEHGNLYYEGCECGLSHFDTLWDDGNSLAQYEVKSVVETGNDQVITYKRLSETEWSETTVKGSSIGVTKTSGSYVSGDSNFFDLGDSNLFGTNDLDGITDTFARDRLKSKNDHREKGKMTNSGSDTVALALNKAHGKDYVNYLYNGAGFKVNYNSEDNRQGIVILRAASGWLTRTTNGYASGTMQLNKTLKLFINDVEVEISDSLVCPGKSGNYGDANANFVNLSIPVTFVRGNNEIKFISYAAYDINGEVLYHDVRSASDSTMSSIHADSITVI